MLSFSWAYRIINAPYVTEKTQVVRPEIIEREVLKVVQVPVEKSILETSNAGYKGPVNQPINTSTNSSSNSPTPASVVTNYNVFNTANAPEFIDYGFSSVITGWKYKDSDATYPMNQYCYITKSTPGRTTTSRANIANMDEDATVIMDPYLDGKKLLTSQTFRDLFRNELIQGNEGINVKDLTVLFTDLKGSTELYDRVGDLKAFNLVNQHFESLAKVIVRNRGAIVKTIGDAVMATFANPLDSVKAATEIVEDLNQFNRQHGGENIIIKIGIHKGSSIAVTLNDRLDYFGQTVNVAARVQGLADAEEIYITDSVYEIEEIQDKISDYTIIPERAKLKGIQEEMDVYKVLIGNSQSTMSI